MSSSSAPSVALEPAVQSIREFAVRERIPDREVRVVRAVDEVKMSGVAKIVLIDTPQFRRRGLAHVVGKALYAASVTAEDVYRAILGEEPPPPAGRLIWSNICPSCCRPRAAS